MGCQLHLRPIFPNPAKRAPEQESCSSEQLVGLRAGTSRGRVTLISRK